MMKKVMIMRILVRISHNPRDSFLVKLHTQELIREIKVLLKARNNSKAIVTALTKGRIEASGDSGDLYSSGAKFILTRTRLSWDLLG
jgi:hypothetical protein